MRSSKSTATGLCSFHLHCMRHCLTIYSPFLDIKEHISWYQEKQHFLISRKTFLDIKNSISWYQEIIHISWYKKSNFWYQEIISWYQEILLLVDIKNWISWYLEFDFLINQDQCRIMHFPYTCFHRIFDFKKCWINSKMVTHEAPFYCSFSISWCQEMNSWYQEIFFDIKNEFLISRNTFWYHEIFFDIKN